MLHEKQLPVCGTCLACIMLCDVSEPNPRVGSDGRCESLRVNNAARGANIVHPASGQHYVLHVRRGRLLRFEGRQPNATCQDADSTLPRTMGIFPSASIFPVNYRSLLPLVLSLDLFGQWPELCHHQNSLAR